MFPKSVQGLRSKNRKKSQVDERSVRCTNNSRSSTEVSKCDEFVSVKLWQHSKCDPCSEDVIKIEKITYAPTLYLRDVVHTFLREHRVKEKLRFVVCSRIIQAMVWGLGMTTRREPEDS